MDNNVIAVMQPFTVYQRDFFNSNASVYVFHWFIPNDVTISLTVVLAAVRTLILCLVYDWLW